MDAGLELGSTGQALLGDSDGDGVVDGSDNCPTIANPTQANRNNLGPGDACELSLTWSCGSYTDYARFRSHKELITDNSPLTLSGCPDLLRIAAPAPANAKGYLSSSTQRIGVRSPNESSSYYDSISGSEVLRFTLGTDSALGGAKAAEVWLRVDGSATASVSFFSGSTSLGTKTASNSGTNWRRFVPDGSALFDRVELRATSGRYGLKGSGDGVLFGLSQVQLSCPSGYQRVAGTCVDVDECSSSTRVCDPLTTCTNTPGSYSCGACPSGYRGTGAASCVDIDECVENSASCSPLVACSNTPGSFQCGACPSGYRGDGRTCSDVDECAENLDSCDPLVTCSNRPGGYDCGGCPSGYSGGGSTGCVDINECVGPNAACDPLTTCSNTPGGFSCSTCPSGYLGTGATSCVDVDECAAGSDDCSPLATCANTAGSYQCGACPSGYRGDGRTCSDVDECVEHTAQCSELVACENTGGGYRCGPCPSGYSGDGTSCMDIDECQANPCDPRTSCENTQGGYVCGACPAGFTGTGHAGCVDIDECADGSDDCSLLVTCGNTAGGFACGDCPAGYSGDGRTCTDLDECASGTHQCDALVTCANTEGSYVCGPCPSGFAGDGHSCTDINECATAPCDLLTACTNTVGSYACSACPAGYSGDGYAGCLDIDECAADNGGCSETDRCQNTPGSRTCVPCAAGDVGVVTHCGYGACAAFGVTSCVRGVVRDSCAPGTAAPSDATCNRADDDCNGQVDEDYPVEATTCGSGACARTGQRTCVYGQVVDSCLLDASAQRDDDCDGVDDDCDGELDEDFVGSSTSCGVGACSAAGRNVCSAGHIVNSCLTGAPALDDDSCDGIDDDCNGSADEDALPFQLQCGTGACQTVALRRCVGGVWAGSCTPRAPSAPQDDSCNGVDDDCDGTVDDDFVAGQVSCGVGACMNRGSSACAAGQLNSACTPWPSLSSDDALCDGIDSDCDGQVDEDFAVQGTSCGLGVCTRSGMRSCVAGQVADSCAPGNPTSAQDTSCNGLDDDCDGTVDEDFSGACSGSTAQVCINGQLVSQTDCSDGILCNGSETCSANTCVRTPAAINDGNPCTTDACSESGGVTHSDLAFGASCSDGNACNGAEICVPCRESENLVVNASFERVSMPASTSQGLLPIDWWSTAGTPDTYSIDGSWGLHPTYLGNFSNVQSVPDGLRWVAGASNPLESFTQELREPLVSGQRYRLTAKLHQAARTGSPYPLTAPGGYKIALSSVYGNTFPRVGDVEVGQIGTTGPTTGWVDVSLEFVAPANIQDKLLLHFSPYSTIPAQTVSYMGLDVVRLVRGCVSSGSQSCQRQDPPAIDDGNACTQDSCTTSAGVLHTPLAVGAACNGSGTCTASGDCTNHPPVITNTPKPYTVIDPNSQNRFYTHQVTAWDPDGDPITFSKVAANSVNVSASGAVNVGGYLQGPAIFILDVQASDGRGAAARQRRLFQFIGAEPPVPMFPTQPTQHAVVAGNLFTHRAKVWSQDPNAPASFAFVSTPPLGMMVDATGLITWTPSVADVGTHEVTVQGTTSQGNAVQTFLVSVLGSPDAPRFTSTPITFVQAGLTYTYQPVAVAGTQALAVQLDVSPSGMAQDPSTGILSWTPSRQQLGAHQIVLSASHGSATTRQAFSLSVVGASDDQPPVVEPLRVPHFLYVGVPWTLDIDAYDPEGTTVTHYAAGLPSGATLNPSTGVLSWTPTSAYLNQTVTMRLGVFDGSGLNMSTDIRVTVKTPATTGNNPPEISSLPPANAKVGFSYSYRLTARDPESDAVTLAATTLPAGANFDPLSGNLLWVPAAAGPAHFVLTATDALGHVATQDFTVNATSSAANLPPEITSTPLTQARLYEEYTYAVSAFEPEGEPVVFALVTGPAGMTLDELTGALHWLPVDSGFADVQVLVRDASGATDSQSFRIQVQADLDAPVIVVSTNPATPIVNTPTRVQVDIQDAGALVTEVLLDGQVVTLDASSGFDTVFTAVGYHDVLVHSADASGNQISQSFRITVSSAAGANQAPAFTSSASFDVTVGVPYTYQLTANDPDGDPLVFAATQLPPGASFDPSTRLLSWTPAQVGSAGFTFTVTDPFGAGATQNLTLVAQLPIVNLAPQIITTPPTQGFAYEAFRYDVDAFEPEGETVTFALESAPSGMTIDAQRGIIDWLPTSGGNFDVEVTARDLDGATATQSFRIEVWADQEVPLVILNSTPRYPRVGETTRITVDVQDEGPVPAVEVLLDGVPVTLDTSSGLTVTFSQPGRHELVVNASDAAGNLASHTFVIGVSADGTPALAPVVTIHNVVDDEVVTLQKDVTVSVSDDDLLSYRLSLIDAGDRTTEVRLLRLGSATASSFTAGTIDATQLINGYYLLRLAATDFAGHVSTTDIPVKIDGGAKIGVVQLSLVDMVIPAPGFDLQVIRSYDSRRAGEQGDFGYGWQLDLHGPRVRSNRPVGEGYGIWNTGGAFSLPCNEQGESRSHFTEVRISDDEYYVFSPSVANVRSVSGTCLGEVVFDQVDGSVIGAELVVVGDVQVYPSRVGITNAAMNLMNMFTGELYDPQHFQLSTPDGRLFDLTTAGGLNWVQDANGNTIWVRASQISHSDGFALGLIRDAKGRISALRNPDGSMITYTYDGVGDLRVTTSAEGFRTRYEYAATRAHHLSKMIDPEGVEQALFGYDDGGRLRQSCGAENHCVELQRDLTNRTEWFIDGEEEVRYTYDGSGNILTETNALNETWTYTYDARNRMLSSLSPMAELTTYTYDRNGNLLSTVEPHEPGESAADFTTTHGYGVLDRRTSTTLPSGGRFTWEYDGRGNEVATLDGSNNVLRSRVYDSYGRLTQETNRFGTWRYARSADGTARTITDPLGRVTTLRISAKTGLLTGQFESGVQMSFTRDRDLRMQRADYGNGLTVDYEYTGSSKSWSAISGPTFGRVERLFWADAKLAQVTEPNGDVREFYYNASRRLTREHDVLGNDTLYLRDTAGRVTQIREVATSAETDFAYDAAGRVLTRTNALDHATSMTYRAGGRLAAVTDPRSHTRTYSETPTSRTVVDALSRSTVRQFNVYGLTLGTSLPAGTSTALSYLGQTRSDESQRSPLTLRDEGSRVRSYSYDAHGGMTSASDLGGQNGWEYSYALTRSAQVAWDAESSEVQLVTVDSRANAYEFAAQGDQLNDANQEFTSDGLFTSELRTVRTPRGDITTFERDSSGRPSRVTLPWDAQKNYTYSDADTNPESLSLPQGTTLSFTYDDAKREVSRTSSVGESRRFVYGPSDRLESITDATGKTTYEYDAVGHFAGIVYPHGGSVRYLRDLLGRTVRQEVRATANATPLLTLYAYDAVGNLQSVTDPLGGATSFVYDAESRLETRTLPNGVVTTYTYDDRDRPLSVVHRNASGVVLVSRRYMRAPGGEPTRITNEDGSYVEIGYDAALRITSERYYTAAGTLEDDIGYTYDTDGNRLTKTHNGLVSMYSYAAGSRLVGVTTEGALEARTADNGGRETSLVVDGRRLSLEYDSDDRITRIVEGAEVTEFAFDAAGRRVGVSTANGRKRFLTAPNMGNGFESPQAITDEAGGVLASHVFAGELPLAKITSTGNEYYLTDTMGSVIGTTDANGSIVSIIKYDAFGNELDGAATPNVTHGDFRLHGMWKDPSGLYFVRARTYDAAAGRFTSRDPARGFVFEPESQTPYLFANASPLIARDPSGAATFVEIHISINVNAELDSMQAPSYANQLNSAKLLLNSSRNNLLQGVKNEKLRNVVKSLYRKNAKIGDGGTADVIRYELETGNLLSKSGHVIKGIETRGRLLKLLKYEGLDYGDRQIAVWLLDNLQLALSFL